MLFLSLAGKEGKLRYKLMNLSLLDSFLGARDMEWGGCSRLYFLSRIVRVLLVETSTKMFDLAYPLYLGLRNFDTREYREEKLLSSSFLVRSKSI